MRNAEWRGWREIEGHRDEERRGDRRRGYDRREETRGEEMIGTVKYKRNIGIDEAGQALVHTRKRMKRNIRPTTTTQHNTTLH